MCGSLLWPAALSLRDLQPLTVSQIYAVVLMSCRRPVDSDSRPRLYCIQNLTEIRIVKPQDKVIRARLKDEPMARAAHEPGYFEPVRRLRKRWIRIPLRIFRMNVCGVRKTVIRQR